MLSHLFARSRRQAPVRGPRRPLLALEALEAREVPATLYALGADAGANQLLRFDSAAPATVTTVSVTGLGTGQTLVGIDFRPRTGQLIGLAVNGNEASLYTIAGGTGAATLIGTATVTGISTATTFGMDFNPVVDRLRVVTDLAGDGAGGNTNNFRLNPNTGALVAIDPDLDLTALPMGAGPEVEVGYTNSFDGTGSTALFGFVSGGDLLVNNGAAPTFSTLTSVGALGVDAGSPGGLDLLRGANGTDTAFAALQVGGLSRLYTVDTATGAATLVGPIGTGAVPVRGLTAVPEGVVVVGSGGGIDATVRRLDPNTGALRGTAITPFPAPDATAPPSPTPLTPFRGAVRVAAGDVNRDGVPDVIAGAQGASGAHVKVFDGSTGAELRSFFAFTGYSGAFNLAVGDVNGDGFGDVLVAADVNGHIKAFSGQNGSELASFLVFQGFNGPVSVAAGDFDNNGTDEVVATAGLNGHTRVLVGSGANVGTLFAGPTGFQNNFFAYTQFQGTVFVAVGDVDRDGVPDIVTGANGPSTHLKAFTGRTGAQVSSFLLTNSFSFPPSTSGGPVNPIGPPQTLGGLSLADVNRDGQLEFVITPAAGLQARVVALDLTGATVGSGYDAFPSFSGGVSVAGGRF